MAKVKQIKLTKDQRNALKALESIERQEDRYLGSVFAESGRAGEFAARRLTAYLHCKSLGMTYENGI